MENHTRNSTQAAIQEKARELFLKKGYAETTVRDIAQATGLTAGSIYRYFKGKKELFDSLDIPEMELVRPEYEKKRADTLRIAMDLFGQKGFEGTTMDEIAVACGVSKATLYLYCESKEDLLVQVLQESSFNTSSRRVRVDPNNKDWVSVVKEIGRNYLKIGDQPERIALLRTVIKESGKFPEIGTLYYKRGFKTACDDVVNYLRALQNNGKIQLRDVDLPMAVETYFATLLSYLLLNRVISGIEETYDPEHYLDLTTDLFLSGLRR